MSKEEPKGQGPVHRKPTRLLILSDLHLEFAQFVTWD